jgi:two-component system nitrate/nitrite response regulator NarL
MFASSAMLPHARPVRILIADDERLFREALCALLQTKPELQVVGTASDGTEALNLVRELKPDVLLLDLAMPGLAGLDALRTLGESNHSVRTIVLTGALRREYVVAALQLGAKGIIVKDASAEVLFTAIQSVLAGRYWLGDEALSNLVEALQSFPAPTPQHTPRPFGLTSRELEVIAGVVAGYSNKEIARRFNVTQDTVKHHLTSIYDKTGVSSRLELALFALNHHLV